MKKTLYVYDYIKLDEFKSEFLSKNIVSFANIFSKANEIKNICTLKKEYVDDCIIDITTIAEETGLNTLFLESYLYALMNQFENVEFSVNVLKKDSLLKKFPHMFGEINTEYSTKYNDVREENDVVITETSIMQIPLLLYKKHLLDSIQDKYRIISIGSFFSRTDNLNYNFNIDSISDILFSKDIQYIDITQIVHTFALRKDLVLTFEIILRQIQMKKTDIQFLISDEMIDEIKKYLPFTFKNNKDFFDTNTELGSKTFETNSFSDDKVAEIIKKLTFQLKGHEDFKEDFSFNLKKFMLLNQLKQRKIFSIFLTGESGIGKTEFAKILSNIMYPKQMPIKINFGNYSNEGVLNSLIGSPLGYIGSEEGGELINKMRLSKSKVILIDEFEKATPSVFHFFYELLEDGKFTDRHGMEHNLDGYIIVFTSNMSHERYIEMVPAPLKSRFDMVYRFVELSNDEKIRFINEVAIKLSNNISQTTSVKIRIENISQQLNTLTQYNNLRSIKRKVEDIVIAEYYKIKEHKGIYYMN